MNLFFTCDFSCCYRRARWWESASTSALHEFGSLSDSFIFPEMIRICLCLSLTIYSVVWSYTGCQEVLGLTYRWLVQLALPIQSFFMTRCKLFMTSFLQKMCPVCLVWCLADAAIYSPVVSSFIKNWWSWSATLLSMTQSILPNSYSAETYWGMRCLSFFANSVCSRVVLSFGLPLEWFNPWKETLERSERMESLTPLWDSCDYSSWWMPKFRWTDPFPKVSWVGPPNMASFEYDFNACDLSKSRWKESSYVLNSFEFGIWLLCTYWWSLLINFSSSLPSTLS